MRTLGARFGWVMTVLLFVAGAAWAAENLQMMVGQQEVYSGQGVTKVSVGNESIVGVRITQDQSQIILTALKAGTTSVNFFKNDGTQRSMVVEVSANDVIRLKGEVASILQSIPGVTLRIVGDRLVLEGTTTNEVEQARVAKVAEMFGNQVINFVALDPGGFIKDMMVGLEVTYIEVDSDDGYKLGVQWPDSIGTSAPTLTFTHTRNSTESNGVTTKNTANNLTGDVAVSIGPGIGLDISGTEADIRTHDVHHLTVENGQKANYMAGGQLNIVIKGVNDSKLATLEYGTILSVTPRLDKSKNIQLAVEAEVSEPDADASAPSGDGGVPAFKKRKVTTLVNLREGESLALMGLSRRVETVQEKGVPGLMNIPILGWLFKSEGKVEKIAHGIIFITPSLYSAGSQENRDKIDRMKSKLQDQ